MEGEGEGEGERGHARGDAHAAPPPESTYQPPLRPTCTTLRAAPRPALALTPAPSVSLTHTHTRTHTASETSPAAISVTLTPHGSATPVTTVPSVADGAFTFPALPVGSHLLEVRAPGLAYHPVWVWVSEQSDGEGGDGALSAAYADAPTRLLPTAPLALRPAARTSPFDTRATFDPVSFAKTPYGLLLIFVAFAVFALPRLRIDPEEYEELLAEQKARRERRGVEGGGVGGEGEATSSPARRLPGAAAGVGAGGAGQGGGGAVRRGEGGGGQRQG